MHVQIINFQLKGVTESDFGVLDGPTQVTRGSI